MKHLPVFTRMLPASGLVSRLLFALCAFALLATSATAAQQLYTCGMHPQVIKTEPGDCPICHMKLTPLLGDSGGAAAGGMGGAAAAQLATISIDPGIVQRMNLKTQAVSREAAEREVRTVGVIAFDERTQRDITTRYEGWIEKLFANVSWQRVKEGEPLFEIYSPALYNAQLNYLVALRSEGEAGGSLTSAALDRLRLLGVSDAFIDELQASGKAVRNYIYRAPADGVIVEKFVRQGQMINAGQPIYSFAELSPVWVLAQVYERDLPLVHAGQSVRVRSSYGQSPVVFEGEVAEVLPQVQEATRAAVARIVLDNPDEALVPGMFADVRFLVNLGDSAVLVPDEAVLRSGEKNTVFVALGDGRFEPREVTLGARTNDHRYVVQEGLEGGESVVVSGQFMLDSESRLREAIAKMVSAATGDTGGMDAQALAHSLAGHNHGASTGAKGKAAASPASARSDGANAHDHSAHGHAGHDHSAHADSSHGHVAAEHAHASHTAAANTQSAHGAMAADHSCCAADSIAGEVSKENASGNSAAQSAHGAGTQTHTAGNAAAPDAVAATADACCAGTTAATPATAEQIAAAAQKREQMRRAPLVVLAFAAADASTALAKDDFAAYRTQLPALQETVAGYVAEAGLGASDPLAAALKNSAFTTPRTIAQAREAFAPFSNRLAEIIAHSGLNKSGVIHIFECPMVPKVGTGRWLQREDNTAWNPYFGAEMLHCGGIVE